MHVAICFMWGHACVWEFTLWGAMLTFLILTLPPWPPQLMADLLEYRKRDSERKVTDRAVQALNRWLPLFQKSTGRGGTVA